MIKLSREQGAEKGSACEIMEMIGEGASCICYQAVFEGVDGVLKEFYPVDAAIGKETEYYFLRRTEDNQLAAVGRAMKSRFKERCEEFISGYRKLDAARKKDARNKILNNYIPVYSILYGCGKEDDVPSVYIWSANDKTGETFERYIEMVRENPEEYPAHKVFNVLNTLVTLTDCIKALHSAGLLHLDLKPSNFLVPYNSMFDINPYSISLFDVDTLYSINNRYSVLAGTPGFVAPEVKRGRGENRSDIYSIGAILFYSLIVSPDLGDGLYKEEYYSQLDQMIQSSELLNASEITSNVFFRACISDILKKCLAKRARERYQNCEELMDDLKKALAYIMPTVMNENLADTRKKLAVLEEEEISDETLTAKMQNLLYKKPLYEDVEEEEEEINVLVLGAGTYAQKFIDTCFQAGQMRGKRVHITAVSKQPEKDKEIYLQFRPALSSFINVDGSLDSSDKEIYGVLNFVPVPGRKGAFSRTNQDENREALERILSGERWKSGVDYVFIALSDEGLNQQMARAYQSLANWDDCPVCTYEADCDDNMEPILKQMAFYSHISWKNSLNIDMEEAWEEFRIKYNYESSLAYALSVKYKLHSVGIELDDPDKAAELFEEKIKDQEILDELTALEHRRWVMEKITSGWSAPVNGRGEIDYDACAERALATGRTYDKVRKQHPCIVKSTKERPLDTLNKESWDQEETLTGLDELDTVSIRLHQCFKARGDKNLYKNYKANDRILVERIPFILTYKSSPYMIVPFDNKGRKNAFANVASASILAPAMITYLVYCDEESQMQRIPGKIAAVRNYLTARGIHAGISLLIGLKNTLPYEEKEELEISLKELEIPDWKIMDCKDEKDAIRSFALILGSRRVDLFDGTPSMFQTEGWDEELRKQIGRNYPSFTFDFVDKHFVTDEKCEYLNYIKEESCIRLEDMARLKDIFGWKVEKSGTPKRFEKLWALYKEAARCHWNALCGILAEYAREHDVRAAFVQNGPDFICNWEEGGKKIQIHAEEKTRHFIEAMKKVLSLAEEEGVRLEETDDGSWNSTQIVWDNLKVENLLIEDADQLELLKRLEKEGFLRELKLQDSFTENRSRNRVSFLYPSLEIRKMLTQPEQILGVYLAQEAEKSGKFAKVYPGFTYQKKENNSKVRVDCVLARGLKLYLLICNFDEEKEDTVQDVKRQFGKDAEVVEITDIRKLWSCL